jgi:hypothetical protein
MRGIEKKDQRWDGASIGGRENVIETEVTDSRAEAKLESQIFSRRKENMERKKKRGSDSLFGRAIFFMIEYV